MGASSPGLTSVEDSLRGWQPDASMPHWLNALRRQAIQAYFDLELPSRSDEAWHYGEPGRFSLAGMGLSSAVPGLSGEKYQRICSLTRQAGRISCLSMAGAHSEAVMQGATLAGLGITVAPFADCLAQHSDLIQHYLGDEQLRFDRSKLLAGHYATLDGGCLVHLPDGAEAPEDIHLLFEAGSPGSVVSPHVLVVAGARARANVYIHLIGPDQSERSLLLPVVQVHCGAGSSIEVTKVQQLGKRCDAWLHETASLARDSVLHSLSVHMGGAHIRAESAASLNEPGGEARLRAAYIASGRMRLDFYTQQIHAAPHAASRLLYKGALQGRARASYQGMIEVAEASRGTDAYQSHRALVLSPEARADSSPQLEIAANDVRCSHGSTVSNVSESELFYLESRGIPPALARRVLVSGFISEIADGVSFEPLRGYIYNYLMEHI